MLSRLNARMSMQDKYGFKAKDFHAAGFANIAEYKKEHGSDLMIRDIEEYDKICKVCQRQGQRDCFKL